jgi:hypothetical protein
MKKYLHIGNASAQWRRSSEFVGLSTMETSLFLGGDRRDVKRRGAAETRRENRCSLNVLPLRLVVRDASYAKQY